jgi:ribonucleoside-diphosphate reductase alpha chain
MSQEIYEDYIAVSRYARYLPELKRRETWAETVERFIDFFDKRLSPNDYVHTFNALRKVITNKEVLPSMRAVMTAGRALERDNVAGYNCAYIAADNIRVLWDWPWLLCGATAYRQAPGDSRVF